MDVEVNALKKEVKSPVVTTLAGIDFVCGTLEGKEVCVAQCSPGKVNAALCAQLMIDKFSPEAIINTGIGCSLSEKAVVKDVVVADRVCQYDVDTTMCGDPKGFISGLNKVYFETDKALSASLITAAKACSCNVISGAVATGDTFIASGEMKRSISEEFGAVCGEMEGGAIGQVCYTNRVPFAVLRSVSDGGDENAQMDYFEFKQIAADISIKTVLQFLKQ